MAASVPAAVGVGAGGVRRGVPALGLAAGDIRVGTRGFEGNKAAPGLLHLLLGGREGMPGGIVVVSEPCG